ncbi:hypothetical protein NIES2135_15190 [Leptolyngbya boryana NIES-2135]|jgi:DNA-binding helix-hairpin-helix protein with protein kinase domain|uniref:Uncharacterized protein n=1 Tax=Leptolyngbya boryana NIES-2135 TaxID=1973484 RepID=A0A1Z4JD91_LEPBY|nr:MULTISPECIES: hypothetical protein [Leptolyngbya]ULP31615.1 hypothetical protein MCP04_07645 [Leptolyngbya boryana IU 594]BAS58963.1 hypothetical protein LBWT_49310 [Leptolyngbya boryana IAM M-101]BAS65311.1 hypothetical protein LBDG_49310 [Leptolyngbya boryana dg5]BAY54701.1 hypothetical protein NIES2135_15190 [Leptolyngbya boryana NIES-2135]
MSAVLNKPSSLLHQIQIEKVGEWNLLKFSDSLQLRMEELLEKKKADQLALEEIGELDALPSAHVKRVRRTRSNFHSYQCDGGGSECQSVMMFGRLFERGKGL